MPATDLKKLQLGQETTWGTAVVATARLMGLTDAKVNAIAETQAIPDLGTLAPSMRDYVTKIGGEASADAVVTYEDVLYFLCGLFGAVTPSGSSPYTWTFSAPLSTTPTPKVYTVEYGDGANGYRLAGAIVSKVNFKIAAGKLWSLSAEFIGKGVAGVTLASLSDRTVEAVRSADTKMYIDAWSGTIGTTEVQGTLISADLTIDAGYHTKDFITGTLTPYSYGMARWTGALKMTLEFNANAKALVDALLTPALVQRQIQIKSTSGTNSIALQFCGTLTKGVELFSDRDGNMTVALEWSPSYNSILANWLKVIVVNTVNALT